MNDFKIIISETNNNPYKALLIKNQFDIESYLGFFDDFRYSLLWKSEFIDVLPQNTTKLVLNICHLPHTPKIYISRDLKNKINNDSNTFLWIFSPHEATLNHINFSVYLKKQGFRLDKVIVTNSDYKVDGSTIAGIKYVSFPEWWEAYYRHLLKTKDDISFITPDCRIENLDAIEKKSLCLNRNAKIHRVWTYYYLLKTGLHEDSFYSYYLPRIAKKDGLVFKEWVKEELRKYNDDFLFEKIKKNKRLFQDSPLDKLDAQYPINLQSNIKEYFEKSALSIITESLETHDFLTEKTFKAIVHSHPFITIGGSNINLRLKERGYKLYDEIFRFEHIDNPKDCMKFMEKLNNISTEELIEYNLQTQTKIEHNWNNFFTRKISFNNFITKIGHALYE